MGKKRKESNSIESATIKGDFQDTGRGEKMARTITMTETKDVQAGDTLFLEVMGASPINKVFDFLIENERTSWSMNEISENMNVGYSTLKILIPKMLRNNLLVIDRKIGKIKLYKLNKENEIIKLVYGIYNKVYQTELKRIRDGLS